MCNCGILENETDFTCITGTSQFHPFMQYTNLQEWLCTKYPITWHQNTMYINNVVEKQLWGIYLIER